MKDVIIGGASGYEWKDLRNWVKSIKQSGFVGDIVLVGTDMKKATIDKLDAEGVQLFLYGEVNKDGDVEKPKNGIEPHVERFFYIWNFLRNATVDYRYVIATDTRDVIFQKNISEWLERNENKMFGLFVGGEGLTYKNEPWGYGNFHNTFGPFFTSIQEDEPIQNVGVIAGEANVMQGLMMFIFQMSVNRPLRICDQASFNFIITQIPFLTETRFCMHGDLFVTHLGTSKAAIEAGSGEIGRQAENDPGLLKFYLDNYLDTQPVIDNKIGWVLTRNGDPFSIVHQYDRVPALKDLIDARYND